MAPLIARPLFPVEQLPNGWRRQWGPGCWAVRSEDGTWFYGFQKAGSTQAQLIWRSFQGWQEVTLDPAPTTRPTLYADPTGLYLIAGADGDAASVPTIYPIPGYKPYGQDSRVAQLITRVDGMEGHIGARIDSLSNTIAALTQRVARLENGGGGGGLTDQEQKILDWLGTLYGGLLQ